MPEPVSRADTTEGRTEPRTVEEACRRYGCDRCDAAPGEPCTGPTGATTTAHNGRFRQATRDGLLPLRDDEETDRA